MEPDVAAAAAAEFADPISTLGVKKFDIAGVPTAALSLPFDAAAIVPAAKEALLDALEFEYGGGSPLQGSRRRFKSYQRRSAPRNSILCDVSWRCTNEKKN
jgi:hypothetical protein